MLLKWFLFLHINIVSLYLVMINNAVRYAACLLGFNLSVSFIKVKLILK
jgi:hypothetical protein